MKDPPPLRDDRGEQGEKVPAIPVIAVDVTALIATTRDMPDRTRKFETAEDGTPRARRGRVKRQERGPCGSIRASIKDRLALSCVSRPGPNVKPSSDAALEAGAAPSSKRRTTRKLTGTRTLFSLDTDDPAVTEEES